MRILIIEDDHKIAGALKKGLEQEKFAVDTEYDGESGYGSCHSVAVTRVPKPCRRIPRPRGEATAVCSSRIGAAPL